MEETLKTDNLIALARLVWGGRVVTPLRLSAPFFGYKTRVIFNDPATILFVGDKKYVSKAHNEQFDEEKGLLMCIAKAAGVSHLELQRMLKRAERPQKKADAEQAGNPTADNNR